jgi:hypothetical protein
MMLYENAIVWLNHHENERTFRNCSVLVGDNGVAEIRIPHDKQLVVTHATNIVIFSPYEPEPVNTEQVTLGDFQYCDWCGQMVHKAEFETHVEQCRPEFIRDWDKDDASRKQWV